MRDRKDDTTHRQNAAIKLGRPLKPSEVVHHADEDKAASHPANMEVKSRGQHTADHNKARPLSQLRASLRMVRERKKLY